MTLRSIPTVRAMTSCPVTHARHERRYPGNIERVAAEERVEENPMERSQRRVAEYRANA